MDIKNLTRTLDFDRIAELLRFAEGDRGRSFVVTVIEHDGILDRLSNDDFTLDALTYPTGLSHVYTLVIRKNVKHLEEIVFHEAAHIRQYEDGRLSFDPITGWAKWKGELYCSQTPYKERPWEKEAFRVQDTLCKAWRDKNRKKRQEI